MDSWIEAANSADFPFFEVVGPQVDYRWSSGYGTNGNATMELAIEHDVGEASVEVTSSVFDADMPAELKASIFQHRAMQSLLAEAVTYDTVNPMPMSLVFSEADMVMPVDDAPLPYTGLILEVNGRKVGWAAYTDTGDLEIAVTVIGRMPEGLALATCTNWAMPDRGRPE